MAQRLPKPILPGARPLSSPLAKLPTPGLDQLQGNGLVVPQAQAHPLDQQAQSLMFSLGPGQPMQEFKPGQQNTRGTVSSAGITQTPAQKAESLAAMDNFDRNTGREDLIAQRHQNLANAEKADVFAERYAAGEIPELDSRNANAGSFTMLKDEQGKIIGAWNPKTGRLAPPPVEGARTGAVSQDQANAAVNRRLTLGKLKELRGLAERNQSELGFYADKVNRLRMSGMGAPIGLEPANPEVIDMYATIDSLKNSAIYDRSGKAINEEEMKRLKRELPNTDEDATTFWVKYNNFLKEVEDKAYNFGESEERPGANVTPSAAPVEKRRIRL